MNFPTSLSPDLNTRAGRMLAAGRVKVTVTSHKTGEHITILFKAFCDNRDRQFKANGKNWEACTLDESTHVFVEVPTSSGEWNDKVGTFYPRTGRWFNADRADDARVYAAAIAATWVNGNWDGESTCQEASECARCGLELTDPVSIARGIGPVCLDKMTGSKHQVKVKEAVEAREVEVSHDGKYVSIEQANATVEHDGQVTLVDHKTDESRQLTQPIWDSMFEWLDSRSDAELESVIANASRILEKREFARREQEQENAAYAAKMERDQTFLGR